MTLNRMKDNSLQLIVIFLLIILVIINTINLVFSLSAQYSSWPTPPSEPLPLPSANSVSPTPGVITSFEECVSAGYPILETYPPQCAVPNGEIFTSPLQ